MKMLKKFILGFLTASLAGYTAYSFLLDETAKTNLKKDMRHIRFKMDELKAKIANEQGVLMDGDELTHRQEEAEHDWKKLGY